MSTIQHSIGTFKEYSLHEDLKKHYASTKGEMEVKIENYIIDVVNNDKLIEIQTRNFSQIKTKLQELLERKYDITLVHPVYAEKLFRTTIGENQSKRKSPKRDNLFAMFNELVYIPELFKYRNFALEIAFTKIEVIRKRIKPNKFRVYDKKLLAITRIMRFEKPEDFLFLIPYELQTRLTTKNLMTRLDIKYPLASKIIYFLAKIDLLRIIQKEGNLKIYSVKTDK